MIDFFRFLFSKVFVINLIIALLLISGGLYATLVYLDDYTMHGKRIEVPDLVGKSVDEVKEELSEGEFSMFVSDSIYEKGTKGGLVLEQDPKALYEVKQGRKIYLTVSANEPPKIEMPKLVDLSLRQASSLIGSYGLELGKLTYQPDPCTNCILDVSIGGKKLEEGDRIEKGTKIDLLIGQGLSNELTDIPYLVGFELEMAKELLQSKYLNVGSMIYDETVVDGEDSAAARIYRYSPFYSEEPTTPMGSSVDLFLTIDTNRIVHTVNLQDSI